MSISSNYLFDVIHPAMLFSLYAAASCCCLCLCEKRRALQYRTRVLI